MIKLQSSVPLSKHTYFKLGGPADQFAIAHSTEELVEYLEYAHQQQLPYLVIGGGSNILIADEGFRGLVIKNTSSKIQLKGFTGSAKRGKLNLQDVIVKADAGVSTNHLIRYTLNESLAGLELFLGLPGTIGGAIYNNSHHLGDFIGNYVLEVEVFSRQGERQTLSQAQLKFAYDYSILHQTKATILSVTFKLTKGDKQKLWQQANSAVKHRADTQPLGKPSSGCIFRNISPADALRLGTPNHTRSVGYLIDKAGLKGTKVGGAIVSSKHANFIINDGTATTQDVLKLIQLIKVKLKQVYGVNLQEEVFVIGGKSDK